MLQLECANKKKEPPLFSCGTKYGAEIVESALAYAN